MKCRFRFEPDVSLPSRIAHHQRLRRWLLITPEDRVRWITPEVADAEIISKEFWPEFSAEDLIRLPNYNVYLKLMVNGAVTRPFSAETTRPNG